MKITKTRYIQLFFAVVFVLMLVKCVHPQIAEPNKTENNANANDSTAVADSAVSAPTTVAADGNNSQNASVAENGGVVSWSSEKIACFFDANGKVIKNRILSVPRFSNAFPDSNQVQLGAAQKYGVSPVKDRHDAEVRKNELVYIGASPYYTVDKLKNSLPYLVPRAAVLLDHIGQNFFDSLQIKQVPLHKFIVTSVLRTREDVDKLRGRNHNATVNSCHLYGTTFDICYNRYTTVSDPDQKPRRAVTNDTLKWVLSEVLRDMRQNNRCYIKYEVKQGCFHITVR